MKAQITRIEQTPFGADKDGPWLPGGYKIRKPVLNRPGPAVKSPAYL